MFSNWRATALAGCALALGSEGLGQVQSGALAELDPWTVSFLDREESALAAGFWQASHGETLLTLMSEVRTQGLSPGERLLLRRLVFSGGDMPEGEHSDDLAAERAQIIYKLGEAEAASQIMPLLRASSTGFKSIETAVDLQLALGQENEACSHVETGAPAGPFWAKLRAVCFALSGNSAGAEFALELAQAEGVDDTWFYEAVFAASGDIPNRPAARFDSGLALVLSRKAGLIPPDDAIISSRPDLLAALAELENLEPALRVQAAGIAAEAGLLDAATHRQVYRALLTLEGFEARLPLEAALQTIWNESSDTPSRARALREALGPARGNAARFSAVSRLLFDGIDALPASEGTARMALDFASASIGAGRFETAARWASAAGDEAGFAGAWIDGLILLGGQSIEQKTANTVGAELIALADNEAEVAAANRLFALWNAVGIRLPAAARAQLAEMRTPVLEGDGTEARPFILRSITAAGEAGAGAEVILRTLELTAGDAYGLSAADAAILIEAVRAIGQEDAARLLALEATGYWRASL